jgi:hypothetical protein
MDVEQTVRTVTREEVWGSRALWFGVLGSPLAWFGHLVLGYSLEEWFACAPATTDRGEILGLGVDLVAVMINSLMLVVAAASGLVAFGCWRRTRRATDGDSLDRSRWMAFVGAVEGAVFVPMILLGYLPPLILDTCSVTP